MKQVSRKQRAKYNKFVAATSHMYEVLFGEDPNDVYPKESSPEAKHLPNSTALNNTSTPVADTLTKGQDFISRCLYR
ncbi:hypothetical protein [Burkholderia thailandensis]|uniref:hypothetical protein n=1 Tax=Burkholderia thailandensis TaxID=57975 RepID=UPI0004BBA763|nr:hypothetical protein [Burkholderia thailandensis]NBC94616.1 hypothetical protein [Burkholderia thailandensis]